VQKTKETNSVKQIRKRITYANVMSSIAVFLVLGGASAYAAKKIGSNEIKGNSITTGKIKKNAITASKIKQNSITTGKIKNGAVTGAKVNVGTLGTVPNATHATNADNATNWSRYYTSGLVKLSVGQTAKLLDIGPFSFYGRCKDLGGGSVEVESFATTSQPGSNIASEESEYYESDFNPGTESEVGYSESGSTSVVANYGYGGYYSGFSASSADGKTLLSGEVTNAIKTYGSDCAVWMFAISAG
jgi:hypothetical protein